MKRVWRICYACEPLPPSVPQKLGLGFGPLDAAVLPCQDAGFSPRKSPQKFEGGAEIRERTFRFAYRAVEFCRRLYAEGGVRRIMAPQIINAVTSVAAMQEEDRAAESRRDVIAKCSIGLNETRRRTYG